jgi:tRNA(Ile2) C34 agmatinyltransferase TiaS
MSKRFIEGSDPGFCVAETIPDDVTAYGKRCQSEVVDQSMARELAAQHDIHLEGCGGTNDGIIGALAAVGLIADGNDGRVVYIGGWTDDLAGRQDVETVRRRNVSVRSIETGTEITNGTIDVGKHLRPNYRDGRIVLFAQPVSVGCCSASQGEMSDWQAIRFT